MEVCNARVLCHKRWQSRDHHSLTHTLTGGAKIISQSGAQSPVPSSQDMTGGGEISKGSNCPRVQFLFGGKVIPPYGDSRERGKVVGHLGACVH